MKYNLRNVDLNLLVILQALFDEGSVTKAARQVGISQSAMSRALGRLRVMLELLLRVVWLLIVKERFFLSREN